jgi:hypothetical protein
MERDHEYGAASQVHPLSPAEPILRSRIGAHLKWSRVPSDQSSAETANAPAAFLGKFEEQARRDFPELDDAEISRLADYAVKGG